MLKQLTQLLSFSVLATGCTFLLQTLATHLMVPAEFGRFAKWLTDVTFLGLFFSFGLDNSLLFYSKGGAHFSENLTRNLVWFCTLLASCVLLILALPVDRTYYLTLSVTVFAFAVYQSLNSANQLAEDFRAYGFYVFVRSFGLLLPFGLITLVFAPVTLPEALLAYTSVSVILPILLLAFSIRKYRLAWPGKILERHYFSYGFQSMLNTLLAVALYTLSIYCLNLLSEPEVVGFFFLAAAVSKLVWIVPDTVGNILYPRFLKAAEEGPGGDTMKDAFFYAQLVFSANVAILIGFIAFGRFFIDALLAPDYAQIYVPTCILLIGNQGMVFYKLLGRYLAAKNMWHVSQRALFAGCVSNVLLNVLLAPQFGIAGAAIATSASFWICGLSVALAIKGSAVRFMNLLELGRTLRAKCI